MYQLTAALADQHRNDLMASAERARQYRRAIAGRRCSRRIPWPRLRTLSAAPLHIRQQLPDPT